VIDPVTATDWLMKIVQVGGPVAGGLLAVMGRVQATRPISGTAAVETVREAVADANAPGAQLAPDLLAMSVTQIERQLPVLLQSLQGIGAMARTGLPDASDLSQPATSLPVTSLPVREQPVAASDPEGLTLSQLKAAFQLFREVADSAPALAGALAQSKAGGRAQIASVAKAAAAAE
jgi:hypothetical protein